MPKIKRNTHEIEIGKEEDIEIRGRRFRFYFQNRYTLISLAVDLLTGIFYIFGSLASLTKIPDRYGTYFYLAGAIFLTIRPILRIVRNIFIYDEKKAMKRTSKKKRHENFSNLMPLFSPYRITLIQTSGRPTFFLDDCQKCPLVSFIKRGMICN